MDENLIELGGGVASETDVPSATDTDIGGVASETDVPPATDTDIGGVASETDVPPATDTDIKDFPTSIEVSNLWERPILSTPLNDYTVTEGLLLLIFLVLAVRTIFKIWNN